MRYIDACENKEWSLLFWKKDNPAEQAVGIYSCGSWRHAGECRQWKGAQDFCRIRSAIQSRGPGWTYLVLTYPQNQWPNKTALYRYGVITWARLRKRFTRRFGKIEYIQTWERHAKGGAHVNVIIHNAELFAEVSGDGWKRFRRLWLEPHAVESGFGNRTWVEPVRGQSEIAGYLVKLARELTGAGSKSQIPIDAPPHFRRIRASQKLLPPPARNPDWTGRMIFCSCLGAEKMLVDKPIPIIYNETALELVGES